MFIVFFAATVASILLAGASPGALAQRVYLVQFSYVNSDNPPNVQYGAWDNLTFPAFEAVRGNTLRVRAGYFGICVAQDDSFWLCQYDIASSMAAHSYVDPLGIIRAADKVKSDAVFPALLYVLPLVETCLDNL